MENMHAGHRERMRDRFLREGLDGFEQHNILELLLFYAIPRKDTNDIAHMLINTFGSLSGVLDAPPEEVAKLPGMSLTSAALLHLIPQICRAYLKDREDGDIILDSTEKAGEYLLNRYIGRKNEVVSMISMDNTCRLLNFSMLSEGSVNASEVNIRKIIETALHYNATSVILAHNHPNGIALPSAQDVRTTATVKQALRVLGVQLIDHIVIAGGDFVSISDSAGQAHLMAMSDEE